MSEQKGRESKYAKKVAEGKQMYGPNCCGHKRTPAQIAAGRKRAIEEGRLQS
jgi:hypothetical protein